MADTSRTYLAPGRHFAFDLSPDATLYSDADACRTKGRFDADAGAHEVLPQGHHHPDSQLTISLAGVGHAA